MTRRLSPRHRTTRLGSSDGRVGGAYEQCALDPFEFLLATPSPILRADGLVGTSSYLCSARLRALAGSDRISDLDCRVVLMADLLGALRLDATAELIMWHGTNGSSIATPINPILDGDSTQVLLGGWDLAVAPDWNAPLVLRATTWVAGEFMEVRALTALTFSDFVGGAR